MRNEGQDPGPRTSSLVPRSSRGFTLIELAVVVAILAVMITLIAPRLGELGEANLKRSSRHLTGMIRFLHEESQAKKTRYRLMFDLQEGRYWPEAERTISDNAVEFQRAASVIGGEASLAGQTTFRDIKVAGHPDEPYMLFTPDGWVERTLIHLRDGSEKDFTLIVKPLTGDTELREGYVEEQ